MANPEEANNLNDELYETSIRPSVDDLSYLIIIVVLLKHLSPPAPTNKKEKIETDVVKSRKKLLEEYCWLCDPRKNTARDNWYKEGKEEAEKSKKIPRKASRRAETDSIWQQTKAFEHDLKITNEQVLPNLLTMAATPELLRSFKMAYDTFDNWHKSLKAGLTYDL